MAWSHCNRLRWGECDCNALLVEPVARRKHREYGVRVIIVEQHHVARLRRCGELCRYQIPAWLGLVAVVGQKIKQAGRPEHNCRGRKARQREPPECYTG